MNILITGATGFVGSHLIQYLKSSKNRIFGAFFPENGPQQKTDNGTEWFPLDITSESETFSAVKTVRPDWIIHLAAISNVRHSWENRRETMETNILGSFHIMDAARQFSPEARILFVSSSDVYGIPKELNRSIKEEDGVQPMSPYACTKISGESLCQFYSHIERLDVIIARSFPHTGPGQSPDFVCSDWAHQIALIEKQQVEPVLKTGNLEMQRDFLDVRDVVRAYEGLMKKGKSGSVYNVCSGKAVALRDILHLLLSLSSIEIDLRVDPGKLRKADIPAIVGDNKKIRQIIEWEPKIPLEQTLSGLLNYWRRSL